MCSAVLLTGATGFIAKHVAVQLLDAGFDVRASTRRADAVDGVRAAVGPALADRSTLDRLTFVVADLTSDAGWSEAMAGLDAVVHTASPFVVAPPRDERELVRPAVDGTLRVLRAAAGTEIDRVVLTSSYVAVAGCDLPAGRHVHDAADWTQLDHPSTDAYTRSKTLAERAAWLFARDEAPSTSLTVLNPGFVLGPPLGDRVGASVSLVRRLLRGRDPMLPRLGLPIVDVRDVAAAHVQALLRTEAASGKRYLLAGGSRWFTEMAATLRAAHPGRRIATRTAPDAAVRLLGRLDRTIGSSVGRLGTNPKLDTRPARADLGLTFRSPEEALLATADHLLARGLV